VKEIAAEISSFGNGRYLPLFQETHCNLCCAK